MTQCDPPEAEKALILLSSCSDAPGGKNLSIFVAVLDSNPSLE